MIFFLWNFLSLTLLMSLVWDTRPKWDLIRSRNWSNYNCTHVVISLKWFLSIALRISTAHDFRVNRNFPQAKLDSKINVPFLLNEHGDLYFLSHNNSVHIVLFNFLKNKINLSHRKKDTGEIAQKTVTVECKLWPRKQRLYGRFTSMSF